MDNVFLCTTVCFIKMICAVHLAWSNILCTCVNFNSYMQDLIGLCVGEGLISASSLADEFSMNKTLGDSGFMLELAQCYPLKNSATRSDTQRLHRK